jgi:hypothetical protein
MLAIITRELRSGRGMKEMGDSVLGFFEGGFFAALNLNQFLKNQNLFHMRSSIYTTSRRLVLVEVTIDTCTSSRITQVNPDFNFMSHFFCHFSNLHEEKSY